MPLVNARRTASLVGPQGVQGAQGAAGAPGTPGAPGGMTNTTANYTQPAVSSTVTVNVNSTAAFQTGNYVAQGQNFYTVSVILGATQMSLQLISGAAPGTLFTAPANIAIVGPAGATGPGGSTGPAGPQGPAGTNGASGIIAPTYFAALSTTTPPVSGHGTTFIDGYASQNDGGQGYFNWVASSTATPDQGTIVQVTGVSTGRWVRVWSGSLNARFFGATGNGSTDDTAAINNAITVFQQLATFGQAPALYFPTGNYVVSSMLVIKDIVGATVYGDGQNKSQIRGYVYASSPAIIRRQNCQNVTFRDLWVVGIPAYTTLTSTAAAGTTVFHVTSTANIVANDVICMDHIDSSGVGAWRELLTVASVNSGASTVTTTVGSVMPYVSTDVMGFPVGSCIQDYSDVTDPGLILSSHQNFDHNVTVGSDSNYSHLFGFDTYCNGGEGSASDIDNDIHIHTSCTVQNSMWSCFRIGPNNSLQNTFRDCAMVGYMVAYVPSGGSFFIDGGFGAPINYCLWLSGANTSHASRINHTPFEASRNAVFIYAAALTNYNLKCTGIDYNGATLQTPFTGTSGNNFGTVSSANGLKPGDTVAVCSATYTNVQNLVVSNVSGTTVTFTTNLSHTYSAGSYLGALYGINVSGTGNRFTFVDCSIGVGAGSLPGGQVYCTDTSNNANSSRIVFSGCGLGFVGYNLNATTLEYGMGTLWGNNGFGTVIETFTNSGQGIQYGGGGSYQYGLGQFILPEGNIIQARTAGGVNIAVLGTDSSGDILIGDGSNDQDNVQVNVAPGYSFIVNGSDGIGQLYGVGKAGVQQGLTSVALSTGTVTLSSSQYLYPYIAFTGSLTGNQTVVLPITGLPAEWVLDFTGCTLNGHTITLEANGIAWSGTVNITSLYRAIYGGAGHLYVVAMTS